jgi:hypothetical protein
MGSREFPRRYLSVRPRAACHASRWPEATRTPSENSRARRGVETQVEATVGSFRARRAKLRSNRGRSRREVTLCRTRSRRLGSVFTVAVLGWRRDRDSFGWSCSEVCQLTQRNARRARRCIRRADRGAGARFTAIAIRHLRSLLTHSPSRLRLPVDGQCQEAVGAPVAETEASARRSASPLRGRTRPGFQPKLECSSHHPVQLHQ